MKASEVDFSVAYLKVRIDVGENIMMWLAK